MRFPFSFRARAIRDHPGQGLLTKPFVVSVQVQRSINKSPGGVAEWSCSGLQSRLRRFDSDPRLQFPRLHLTLVTKLPSRE